MVTVRKLRLWAGLTLFAFVLTHLLNHALGLVSLDAMERGRVWFLAVWRSVPGSVLLSTAFTVHVLLGLWSLYQRRHLRMPAWEATQLGLGLTIPLLLAPHVIGTRLAGDLYGAVDSYSRVLLALWVLSPELAVRQTAMVVIVWVHGCMGLHFWLRFRPGYARRVTLLFGVALLLPVLALLGFAEAGREVGRMARDPAWVARTLKDTQAPDLQERAHLARIHRAFVGGYGSALGLTMLARAVRQTRARVRGGIRITYPDDRTITVPAGLTVLEASRLAGIPHTSVCGGRGRCSTCRVRVGRGLESQPPASSGEQRVLHRVGAATNVRLACQLRPTGPLSVTPLVPAVALAHDRVPRHGPHEGGEREIAILFADLRSFTPLAERRLPYDVVFLLNRYFEAVGTTIERAGGVVNQFTGDGVMALFGVDTDVAQGSRQAVRAAGDLVESVAALSHSLREELPAPLRIGIGVHAGPAVVGRMGYGVATYLTAVGDTVHVASRLQELTKEYGCQLVISERVATEAGLDVAGLPRHELTIRGRAEPMVIRVAF